MSHSRPRPLLGLLAILVALAAATTAAAGPDPASAQSDDLAPGGGEVVRMARPTWDTGWFQAEIVARLLGELGYRVEGPSTSDVEAFYADVESGAVDLWVNGWFPQHEPFLTEGVGGDGPATVVGVEVDGGALQGYAVDLAAATDAGIDDLSDLADPEVAARFDLDGDGRADLIGCNREWSCHPVVEHHLEAYGLAATVEQVSGDYGPLMEATVARHRAGEPVLYYTYTPNWTGGELVPGRDVAWLPVPFPSLPAAMADQESETSVAGIGGCAQDPCPLGFPPNDIRAVANTALLDRQPAIKALLERFTIDLDDISTQNARMFRGEDSADDIEGHAAAWIEDNRERVDGWLDAAVEAHLAAGGRLTPRPAIDGAVAFDVGLIRVAARPSEPFVIYADDAYVGFTMELLDLIADEIGAELEIYGVTSNAKLVDDVARGEADIGAGALAVTSRREARIDFSQPYFDSGLEIMIPSASDGVFGGRLRAVLRTVFSLDLLLVCLSLIVVLFGAAHVIWLAERRSNPEFPPGYREGVWEAFWWAAVTATTVGYGDKTPKGVTGRLFGLLWMFVGLFVLAYFTAGIASAFTIDELEGRIEGPADLRGHEVAVVADSLGAEYMAVQGLPAERFEQADQAYAALLDGEVDAVVHDAALLRHFVTNNADGGARLTGLRFEERGFGFALANDSELTEAIDIGLISVIESGRYRELRERWFGTDE